MFTSTPVIPSAARPALNLLCAAISILVCFGLFSNRCWRPVGDEDSIPFDSAFHYYKRNIPYYSVLYRECLSFGNAVLYAFIEYVQYSVSRCCRECSSTAAQAFIRASNPFA